MDASASPKSDAVNVLGFFLKLDGANFVQPVQQKNTVIKYTKIPEFEFDTKVSWPSPRSYTLQPRLRRIITIDNDNTQTQRSLRSKYASSPKRNDNNRKIATIPEQEEYGLHPRFYEIKEKTSRSVKTTNRSVNTDGNSQKQQKIVARLASSTKYSIKEKSSLMNKSEPHLRSQRQAYSRSTNSSASSPSKYTKETKTSAKTNSLYNKKEVNISQSSHRPNQANSKLMESVKSRHTKEKALRNSRKGHLSNKNFNVSNSNDQDLKHIKHILYENLKTELSHKQKSVDKPLPNRLLVSQNKNKVNFKNVFIKNTNPITVRVPLDNKLQKFKDIKVLSSSSLDSKESESKVIADCSNYTDDILMLKHVNVGTNSHQTVDQVTEMEDFNIENCKCDNSMQTEYIKEIFDSLEIPNVTLTKDKSEVKEETVKSHSASLPNFKIPPYKEKMSSGDISICESASYVYSRATLTYTTRQKINIQVVGKEEKISPSIVPSPLNYPLNVMSVFKNELKKKQENVLSDDTSKKKHNTAEEYVSQLNELDSINCSYVSNKLMKPSEVISTIRVNNGLLENDFICEQFQKELNFIDSFFASLQYLESCSLSDKCFSETKVDCLVKNSVLFDPTVDAKSSVYNNFLSKLENGANIDDSETMASKSLCLLNLLIRDEQRRAKNLLFVLKMREDALKDFTKSQILWLEKKKKHDNTDISTLKKKQRGALLKLQHECGEMQRMRKALLTLSEKRKIALMKTKKNIELKLNNNVDVEHIILGKKKLKRTSSGDRNASPLKCFDLSSSGCEDSTTPKPSPDAVSIPTPSVVAVESAEKCVQTGDGPVIGLKEHDAEITAENFVAVDGGYLNIIFHDLALPQIFSSGRQYEVNEKELKNIVSSTNNPVNGTEIVEKLMEQIKNRDLETSSPSTARSLVEEFDQYYRGLAENDSSAPLDDELECEPVSKVVELKSSDVCVANSKSHEEWPTQNSLTSTSSINKEIALISDTNLLTVNSQEPCVCELGISETNHSSSNEELETHASQRTGPLPVPVGAAAVVDTSLPDVATIVPPKSPTSSGSDYESISSQPQSSNPPTVIPLTAPVQSEAEELRRQQLAIEREIKALEQQQCRMLVVREIPDKPPPPYTPPTETKPKPPRKFVMDDNAKVKIETYLTESLTASYTKDQKSGHRDSKNQVSLQNKEEAFDIFIADFCQESVDRHKQERSNKPWDACNLLPQKPQRDMQTLLKNTTTDIKEVLTNVTATVVSGVSGRRSDHIDDILFNEWRRCEPEWTTLHTDEAIVKNQIFDSIFQKILTETIEEYKKTVKPE